MAFAFQRIGLIAKYLDRASIETLKVIRSFLQDKQLKIFLEEKTSRTIPGHGLPTFPQEELGNVCDLVVVIGGDGHLLNAARSLAPYKVPVLGVNRGQLGFLTDISPDDFASPLTQVLAGDFLEEKRFLLQAQIFRQQELIEESVALNDVVLKAGLTKMMEFELYINSQFVYSQRSDGIIITTPTGSTAYALSGGGPILHPTLQAIALVPMFPHTLTSRPIVVNADSVLDLVVPGHNTLYPHLLCDGQVHFEVAPGNNVRISKSKHFLRLIHPSSYHYYETLRTKLQWGTKL